jgi:hypothetical protein
MPAVCPTASDAVLRTVCVVDGDDDSNEFPVIRLEAAYHRQVLP